MSEKEAEDNVDLSGAKHDVWLVKVPKYLATRWLNAPDGCPVGKLRLTKNGGKTDVTYSINPALEKIPVQSAAGRMMPTAQQHRFVLQGVGQQSLAVFSTPINGPKAGQKRSMEGRVVQKVDCRPIVGSNYMQIKKAQLIEACKPKRTTQQLDSAVKTTYKPVSITKEEREYQLQKKMEGKKIRLSREELESKLFEAFEKHQYYSLKDLKAITMQPTNFLSEVLKDIGVYGKHTEHLHMWELKEEYRHHQHAEKSEDSSSS